MSQVVIGDILPYTQAIATGGQTVFGTNWTADTESDVVVYRTSSGSAADDVAQILPYPSGYSVAFIGAQQDVQVTLVTGANAGDRITITRQTPADRENLYSNTNFTPSMLNSDFGILTLVDQQAQLVNQKIGPRYNYSAVIVDVVDTILPVLAANQFWAKNATNDEIVALNISDVSSGGTVTQIDTGLGLTGGPITLSGTISFSSMAPNTFWGNITGSVADPTQVTTDYFLKTANNLSDLTNVPQAQINIGLEIGVDVQAYSASLTSLAGLSTSANQIPYLTSSNTWSVMAAQANNVLVTNGSSVPSLQPNLPTLVQGNIVLLGTQTQALNMGSHQINNVTDPTNAQDAATKNYVDSFSGAFLPLIGGTMQGAINMGAHKITNMTDPSSAQDAVTLSYLNTALGDYLPLSGGTMSGQINMGSNKITNVTDPTNPQDAATKNYVDTVASGFTIQPACYAATTANLTALYVNGASGIGATLTNSGALAQFTTDGTTPPTNARILVWNQSSTLENGIYTLTNQGSGAVAWILTRATDYDQPAEIQPGDLVIINNGTLYAGTSFIQTDSVAAVGTDPIQFSQFTFSATAVLLKANNLSDVASTTTSFNNISPLTTKGDLIAYNSGNVRLPVGLSDGQLLQVSSGAATGLAWSTATYPSTTSINRILYSSSANVVGEITSTAGGVLVTDASSVPQFLANPSVSGKLLASANAAIPIWTTPTYPTASGSSGKMLQSDGTNIVYSTPTFPTLSAASGKILISDGTNWIASTPTYPNTSGASGKVLFSDGTNIIYSTPTFPNASATVRKIIVSDGTNWVASTETYAVPGTSGHVMTSDGTNWISSPATGSGTVNSGTQNQLAYYAANGTTVSGLATANGGVLVTSNTGVPSILVGSGSTGTVLQATASGTPAWSSATYPLTTTVNQILYSSATNVISGIATANSGVLVTSAGGVPSISTTLPNSLAMGTPASLTLTNATGLPVGAIASIANNTVVGNNSGSSASPSAISLSGVGGFQYITQASASSSSAITFTGLTSSFSALKIIINDLIAASGGTALLMRCSTNNGSSYDSGNNYQYAYTYVRTNSSTLGVANTSSASSIGLQDAVDTSNPTHGEITMIRAGAGRFLVYYDFPCYNVTFGWERITGGGVYTGGTSVNAVQFLMSSGNIAAGNFYLYGLPNS